MAMVGSGIHNTTAIGISDGDKFCLGFLLFSARGCRTFFDWDEIVLVVRILVRVPLHQNLLSVQAPAILIIQKTI